MTRRKEDDVIVGWRSWRVLIRPYETGACMHWISHACSLLRLKSVSIHTYILMLIPAYTCRYWDHRRLLPINWKKATAVSGMRLEADIKPFMYYWTNCRTDLILWVTKRMLSHIRTPNDACLQKNNFHITWRFEKMLNITRQIDRCARTDSSHYNV